MPIPAELPVANHVVSTSSVEEPPAPAAGEPAEEALNTPVKDEEAEKKPVEEEVPEVPLADVTPSEPESEPEAPAKELQQLELAVEDEKEVDTAEDEERSEVTEASQEEKTPITEETNTPAEEEEEEEDRYKHLKVTLTLPDQDNAVLKEEDGEKPTEKDEKTVPDRAKDDKERDSDSGNGSAADNSSIDLNLSISSFLSKAKEAGSVSIQVTHTVHTLEKKKCHRGIYKLSSGVFQDTKRQKKTLKKTRKFIVDGVEVSVTTSKIITDNDTKNEEMRFLR